ncbi:hypothetical protein K2173_003059 [Erythroxylum novogranatense]|uniref:Uncharacterized protein n=1 Tax=Erythroxylum novogranatense TaxID=1862640 RepID=A0AAV8S8B1_9ROSI|nr:hypothetical protein K2173_003059 [Erythroxylum novogranatense]
MPNFCVGFTSREADTRHFDVRGMEQYCSSGDEDLTQSSNIRLHVVMGARYKSRNNPCLQLPTAVKNSHRTVSMWKPRVGNFAESTHVNNFNEALAIKTGDL